MVKYPIVIGHELAGVISEIGEGVEGYKVGDRVALCPATECPGEIGPGFTFDGGYGTKVCAPASDLVKIPDGVDFAVAAASTDAGMTSFHALFRKAKTYPGMKVALIGIGGLGQMAARAAVLSGFDVYAVDNSPEARDLAHSLGIEHVYETVNELAPVAPELIVDYAGVGSTTVDAINVAAPGGTVVLVGIARPVANIQTEMLVLRSINLIGSAGGDKEDIAHFYDLVATGEFKPNITKIGFDEIPEGLERLHKVGVKGRLVAVYD